MHGGSVGRGGQSLRAAGQELELPGGGLWACATRRGWRASRPRFGFTGRVGIRAGPQGSLCSFGPWLAAATAFWLTVGWAGSGNSLPADRGLAETAAATALWLTVGGSWLIVCSQRLWLRPAVGGAATAGAAGVACPTGVDGAAEEEEEGTEAVTRSGPSGSRTATTCRPSTSGQGAGIGTACS